jgi:hypothetical protein
MTEISSKGDSDAWIQRAILRQHPGGPRNAVGIATGGALPGPSIEIDMTSTNPELEAQRRLEREAEAARMRQENALPVWLQETQDPKAQRLREQAKQDAGSSLVDDVGQAGTSQIAADQEDCESGSVVLMLKETESRYFLRPSSVCFDGQGGRGRRGS